VVCSSFYSVNVSVPFHAAGVRFVGGLLGPLIGYFVAFDPVVAGAPPHFDPDPWLLAAEFGDVFPCRDGVSLSRARAMGVILFFFLKFHHSVFGRARPLQMGVHSRLLIFRRKK